MAFSFSEIITYSFVFVIILYSLSTIAGFYSVSSDSYLPYYTFYIFLALSIAILSNNNEISNT